jgi:Uma2 family endonuclease
LIGNPKQLIISIYLLVDGEYQVRQFRNDDACGERIESPTFPDLNLTAEQIFAVGGVQVSKPRS